MEPAEEKTALQELAAESLVGQLPRTNFGQRGPRCI
jgi:hypothetical protein